MTDIGKIKIELSVPNFFFLPMKRVELEAKPETGRTYFIFENRIVAVGKREQAQS